MSFHELKPSAAVKLNGMSVKTESLKLGRRCAFDDQEMGSFYRDAKRGEQFVLLRTTFRSLVKRLGPNLPDVAV